MGAACIVSEEKTCEEILAEAIAQRDRLLRERPELMELQNEIDRILKNAAGFEDRIAILAIMLQGKLQELTHHLANLLALMGKDGHEA